MYLKQANRQTDGWTDRQTDEHTGTKNAGMPTDIDRQAYRQRGMSRQVAGSQTDKNWTIRLFPSDGQQNRNGC